MKLCTPMKLIFVFSLLCTASSYGQTKSAEHLYRIPLLQEIHIDGSAEDWNGQGFHVEVMADIEGRFRPPEDFDPRLRLGWNTQGLLVLAQVRDNGFLESDIDRRLFLADSVEFFLGTARDEHDYLMLLIAPGLDPKHPEPRHIFFDERDGGPVAAGALPELHAQIAVSPSNGGYTIETLIPWSNLDLTPRTGLTVAFQAYAMDRDPTPAPGTPGNETFRVAWYPAFDTHQNQTTSMMTLELSESPSSPVEAAVRGRYRDIEVIALKAYVDTRFRVEREGKVLGEAVFTEKSGRAAGALRLHSPLPGQPLGRLDIFLGDQLLETVERGSAAAMMGIALEEGNLTFYQHVFSGSTFPQVEFENKRVVEDLIGPHQVTIRFYGPDLNEVKAADIPGRYGAIVTVSPSGDGAVEDGKSRSSSRFFTLFRTPDDQSVMTRHLPPWIMPALDTVTLPGGLTLTPEIQEDYANLNEVDAIRRAVEWIASDRSSEENSQGASDIEWRINADLSDQEWWVRCKRVYYGLGDQPTRLPLPRPLSLREDSGTDLREGTPEEAGLSPSVIEPLEAICDRLVALNHGQGFTICVARHGVAFFHRAYGQVDGAEFTLQSQARVRSVTKTITGAMLMTYMDQALIDLDAPIETYLPLYRNVPVSTPFTIRQLMTHTSGLSGHFGDEQRDLEERIADEYPRLSIPSSHIYSGRGFALTVKVLEAISGKPLPTIYEKVLTGPLGMNNTTVKNSHNAAYTTAWDLAKMGQLMLNGGTYGGYRFFTPKTLEEAKPKSLVTVFGKDTNKVWGIGFWGSREAERRMLGGTAFGHNSGNSSFFRVDPSSDLVVTIASTEDKRYMSEAMHKELIEVIEAAIKDFP